MSLALAICSIFFQCADQEILPIRPNPHPPLKDSVATEKIDSAALLPAECKECTYVVPAGVKVIDGKALRLKPGSIIGLSSAIKYRSLEFHNIVGTKEQPIIIKNCGGTANITADDPWHAIKTQDSKYFRITGGSVESVYGIKVQGGEMGLKLDGFSTNFEIDHVEVSNATFAGLMAKTDPTCDNATLRGNFTMYDVLIHDNYVHHTGGEGFYIGNSFWDGMNLGCGKRLPHEIKGLKVYNNIVSNTGWEGIQVGCAISGTEIYNNTVKNYGTANIPHQNNGVQIGSGTGGVFRDNLIKKGTGNGLIVMGTGDNMIYNNIIVDAGENGIFCDERYTPGEGFKFINNTILNPKNDGIRLYAELVPMNTILNNIIANPGSYASYGEGRTIKDSFVYLLSTNVKVRLDNNMYAASVKELQFVDPSKDNYRLKPNSPAINFGRDISKYKIEHDFYSGTRLRGVAYDAGASEY